MDEVVGSVLSLRAIRGKRVSSVEVVSDSEVVLRTPTGQSFRLRAEKEARHGDPVEPVTLVCEQRGLRP